MESVSSTGACSLFASESDLLGWETVVGGAIPLLVGVIASLVGESLLRSVGVHPLVEAILFRSGVIPLMVCATASSVGLISLAGWSEAPAV